MLETRSAALHLKSFLAKAEEAAPADVVKAVADHLRTLVPAVAVRLLLANLSGSALVRVVDPVGGGSVRSENELDDPEQLDRAGSRYARALLEQHADVSEAGGAWKVLLPVSERGDAIGILEVLLGERPGPEVMEVLQNAARALAYVLIAARRHTDRFENIQRDTQFSVAAEIQRRLLPSSYTAEDSRLTLAGWLEPAHNVGGDTFDYSIDEEWLYVSVTDAMGHSVRSALLATLAVSALRNSRRAQGGLAELAAAAHCSILEHGRELEFVTAQLLRISLDSGTMEVVNAGHPLPYLLRKGSSAALPLVADTPLGIGDGSYQVQRFRLEPGDRLVLLTDGYLERNAADVDLGRVLASTRDRHPRQVVQELAAHLLDLTGEALRDDATTVCVDWHGRDGRREPTAAADGIASSGSV